jgi:Na+-driven multidrug efflux pump
MSNMTQQVTGKTIPATFLAMARQGIFFIPCVLILPLLFDQLGIQMAQMISDLCTFLCAVPLQLYILRRLGKE